MHKGLKKRFKMFKFQQIEMKVEVVVQTNLHLPCLLEEGKIAEGKIAYCSI